MESDRRAFLKTTCAACSCLGAVALLEGLAGPPAEAAGPWLSDARARLAAARAGTALQGLTLAVVGPMGG